MSNHFEGGLGGRCKVRCGNGLRRDILLDGVFVVGRSFEVVLGKGFASMRCSRNGVFLGTYRVGMWPVAIRYVPCGYMEGTV